MARRVHYRSPQCAHEGCGERANYEFTSMREQREYAETLRKRGGWRCVRHTSPDEVLTEDAPIRETVLVSRQETYGRFFAPEGVTKGGGGFQHGPGFKVYAEDFPTGTRLIVTARVEIPDAAELEEVR